MLVHSFAGRAEDDEELIGVQVVARHTRPERLRDLLGIDRSQTTVSHYVDGALCNVVVATNMYQAS